ncbi:MAG TPA: histidine phosphatase family protein [Xanthobacteraceae bacterium]|nr:histidine phosphatase family protein [Xanthobacteraceae bacterium]
MLLSCRAADMRLMLLRHAKTEKAESGMRDRERRLNARGRDDAAEIAAHMVRHALLPDRVLVSSAQRTRETWERMAAAFSAAVPVDYQDRLYESGTETILTAIKATDASTATLLLIGHNPGLYDTARLLLAHRGGEAHALDDGLPTSGLVVIDFADDGWRKLAGRSGRLQAFVTPRLIKPGKD